jgi:hypothetical protein
MANMLDAVRAAVMAVIAHCLSVGGMVAPMLRRALALLSRRASSASPRSATRHHPLFDLSSATAVPGRLLAVIAIRLAANQNELRHGKRTMRGLRSTTALGS